CLRLHGAATFLSPRLILATTGDQALLALIRPGGVTLRRLATGLAHDHLMEFVLSRDRVSAFALGSCGYAGGLSVVRVKAPFSSPTKIPRSAVTGADGLGLCGERGTLDGSVLVLTQTRQPVPDPGRP